MFAARDVAITQLTSKASFGGLRPARVAGSSRMSCFNLARGQRLSSTSSCLCPGPSEAMGGPDGAP